MLSFPRAVPVSRIATTILRTAVVIAIVLAVSPLRPYLSPSAWPKNSQTSKVHPRPGQLLTTVELGHIEDTARRILDSPLKHPYKEEFGELGRRAQQLRGWISLANSSSSPGDRERLEQVIESTAQSLFPFLQSPPGNPRSSTPLADLVSSFHPRSRGIVIPTGSATLRFTFHSIASLREVLNSTLPIEIAYAGDQDLPPSDRWRLQSRFDNIRFLDVLAVFNDTTLDLKKGGWAIKPFAALASSFEEVIVVDADAVFLQSPEILLEQRKYRSTGALLFHDRLLWKDLFKERREWWRSQISDPSDALSRSLVWTEGYAEECDSGVVVVNKSRPEVLVGLLHVAWQNTREVREEVTYTITYGDKESWWLGLELAGSGYAFEAHYAAMIGWPSGSGEDGEAKLCSFVIGHLDERERLLWYNGGLLKNKKVDGTLFGLPTHWMVDGTWLKGARRTQMSCMVGERSSELAEEEKEVIRRSIGLAREMDTQFGF
ncbi:related to MNT3 - alpha-1,3-mannosyltransferases responsible for adding the terminal mannose resi [Cephalotrichum gorgonifer]|uniref:Related to MNT3 - alpha-1,3-mannosyltransferases responsible for adding the terminal mannose resi n=1 Tax=Cephalotrichum gorgonifer TaxID=2041049 RepID=A0AAE8SU59_9PEZI|nr:related to MNT3 - alpha-1,3-mannosyltransferases responsible for adding the terminal mannose resi [Cephalotrichum gorgonifer]